MPYVLDGSARGARLRRISTYSYLSIETCYSSIVDLDTNVIDTSDRDFTRLCRIIVRCTRTGDGDLGDGTPNDAPERPLGSRSPEESP